VKLTERRSVSAWREVKVNAGTLSVGRQVGACLPPSAACTAGLRRWLRSRRAKRGQRWGSRLLLASGVEHTSAAELLRVSGVRRQTEARFAEAKGEIGPDQCEMRTCDAWHRFVTNCLLAHAGLVVVRVAATRLEARDKGAQSRPDPGQSAGGPPPVHGADRQR
jgi:hypothetical protein